jgi:hypothetical protein
MPSLQIREAVRNDAGETMLQHSDSLNLGRQERFQTKGEESDWTAICLILNLNLLFPLPSDVELS